MDKQLILLDFDKTLFDIKSFFEKYFFPALGREFGVSEETLSDISKDYRGTLTKSTQFDPEGWIKIASSRLNIDPNEIRTLLFTPTFFERSLFPEVIPTLIELSHDNVLGIYSEAVYEWQMKKIELSGLINYFEQRFISISEDKVSDIVIDQIPVKAIVVDDRLEVIAALKRRKGIYPVWLNRQGLQGMPSVMEIRDLSQILRVAEQVKAADLQLD